MEQQELQKTERVEFVIDALDICSLLWQKIWLILLTGVAASAVLCFCTIIFVEPQYESTTKMYVMNQQSGTVLTQQDFQTSTYVAKDYREMIESRTVAEEVITKLNLSLTSKELREKISANAGTDTRIVSISVRDTDPARAQEIADTVRDVAAEYMKKVMNIDAVNVMETADFPETPVSPSMVKRGVIGFMAGCAVMAVIIFVTYVINGLIETPDDVRRYLELNVLGAIPMEETGKKKRKKRRKAMKQQRTIGGKKRL